MDAIVTQMIILFILVIIGYYLSKKKMMDADFDRKLSGLVINVTCPSLILSSVMGDTLPDKTLILPLLVVGFATYVVLIGLAFLLPRYCPSNCPTAVFTVSCWHSAMWVSSAIPLWLPFLEPVRCSMPAFLISPARC